MITLSHYKLWRNRDIYRVRRSRFLMVVHAGIPDPLEWLFCALKSMWGLWMLTHPDALAVAPHLYRYVLLLPVWFWGLVWLGTGAAQGAAWYLDYKPARWGLSVGGTGLWTVYAILMWFGDHRTSALVFVGVLAGFQALAAYWLSPRLKEMDNGKG